MAQRDYKREAAKQTLKIAVDNGPSVFIMDLIVVDLQGQWDRKLYHRKVVREHTMNLQMKGVKTNISMEHYYARA